MDKSISRLLGCQSSSETGATSVYGAVFAAMSAAIAGMPSRCNFAGGVNVSLANVGTASSSDASNAEGRDKRVQYIE